MAAGALLFLLLSPGPASRATFHSLAAPPEGASRKSPFPAGDKGYLIVAPESLLKAGAVQSFADHKRKLGFNVVTIAAEEIEKKYVSGELADRIRQYLKDNAGKLGLRYVLLVGDPDPADNRVKLPFTADLLPYVVSAPSRSLGGTYATDKHNGEIASEGRDRIVILTGPNLQVLRPGTLRYWYVNCTKPGKIQLVVSRREGENFKHVVTGKMQEVTRPGVAIRATMPVELEAGDYVGFLLPREGAATVAVVNTPGTTCAQTFEFHDGKIESGMCGTVALEVLPLFQCSVYFEPEDRVGSVPSKMCWPMGTYNGVYGAVAHDSCLAQCPTDAYYANLSGDWDANENGFFGETFLKFFRYDGGAKEGELSPGDFRTPADSYLPELLVGRIPFDDPETVGAILEKTISYETSQDKDWRKHCLLAADPLAPDTDNYALCELLKRAICDKGGFKATRFYTEHDFDGEVQSPKRYKYEPEVLVTLDELKANRMAGYERFAETWSRQHPGLVLWSSHANTDICRNIITLRDESDANYPQAATHRYVEALDDSHPAIVFAAACSITQQEGYYLGTRKKRTRLEHDWEKRPNLGRELLKNGAVAVVAPSRSIWFQHGWNSVDDGGCLSLAYLFALELVTGGREVSYSLASALRGYHARWGSELGEGENVIGFQVYGDPSLKLGVRSDVYVTVADCQRGPVLSVTSPRNAMQGIKVKATPAKGVEVETGSACETEVIQANADGSEEWFTARGFSTSGKRSLGGGRSYYSGTARHTRTTLTLNMPLSPRQELKASFDCWYDTEPGLDYVVFEKSPDMVSWEPLGVYSGSSTARQLFDQCHPAWLKKTLRFSTRDKPAYLRFRCVTNDKYRKEPREGFYMDNFKLRAVEGGVVRYISGWQRLKAGPQRDVFVFKPPRAGEFYLRAGTTGEDARKGTCLGLLTVSPLRAASWRERVHSPGGVSGCISGLVGLFLLLVAALRRSS